MIPHSVCSLFGCYGAQLRLLQALVHGMQWLQCNWCLITHSFCRMMAVFAAAPTPQPTPTANPGPTQQPPTPAIDTQVTPSATINGVPVDGSQTQNTGGNTISLDATTAAVTINGSPASGNTVQTGDGETVTQLPGAQITVTRTVTVSG